MDIVDLARQLGYDPRWIDFGVVDRGTLTTQIRALRDSDDHNLEHYRWRAFTEYFARIRSMTDEQVEGYLQICETSEDELNQSLVLELVRFRGLTDAQLERLSGRVARHGPDVLRIVRRMQLLRALRPEDPGEAAFRASIESGDGEVHRKAVEHTGAPVFVLEALAERGANKAVRNVARNELRRRKPQMTLRRSR